jgi:hypothetical protein
MVSREREPLQQGSLGVKNLFPPSMSHAALGSEKITIVPTLGLVTTTGAALCICSTQQCQLLVSLTLSSPNPRSRVPNHLRDYLGCLWGQRVRWVATLIDPLNKWVLLGVVAKKRAMEGNAGVTRLLMPGCMPL